MVEGFDREFAILGFSHSKRSSSSWSKAIILLSPNCAHIEFLEKGHHFFELPIMKLSWKARAPPTSFPRLLPHFHSPCIFSESYREWRQKLFFQRWITTPSIFLKLYHSSIANDEAKSILDKSHTILIAFHTPTP